MDYKDDILKLFEDKAKLMGWRFVSGTKATQNLFDSFVEERHPILFVDHPIKETFVFDDYNVSGVESEIKMLLGISSDFNEQINNETGDENPACKYFFVKDLKAKLQEFVNELLKCEVYAIKSVSYIDVYNLFDYNIDGLYITIIVER